MKSALGFGLMGAAADVVGAFVGNNLPSSLTTNISSSVSANTVKGAVGALVLAAGGWYAHKKGHLGPFMLGVVASEATLYNIPATTTALIGPLTLLIM